MPETVHTTSSVPRGGIDCPTCASRIAITVTQLVTLQRFTCTACGTTLTLQRAQSAEALTHARVLRNRLRDRGFGV